MVHRKKQRAATWLSLLASLYLNGCGGGGGGGSEARSPSVIFTPTSVSLTKPVNLALDPATGRFDDVTVKVSIANITAATFFPVVDFTRNTLDGASLSGGSPSSLTLTLTFKPPESLALGSHQDQVTVKACEDLGCSRPIARAQGTLSIMYEVTAPPPGQEPSINFSTLEFAAQSLPFDPPVDRFLPFSLANFGALPFVSASHQTSTVQFINSNVTSVTAGNLEIVPTQGFVLGKGVFTDVLSVTVCLDIDCVNPVAGSPFTINYTYTVGDTITVAGANGYVLRATNIDARAAAWDAVSQRFYVGDRLPPYELVALDPETGQTGAVASLAALVNGAAVISDDGRYLYMGLSDGRIQRLRLTDFTSDLTFDLGRDSFGGVRYANDIAVMPGQPGTIAVSYSTYPVARFDRETTGAALYDDGVARADAATATANPPSGTLANVLSFSPDGTSVYGAGELFSPAPKLYVLPVVASGFAEPTTSVDVLGGRAHPVGQLIYMDGGTVVDLAASNTTQTFGPMTYTFDSLPAPDVGRIFVLGSNELGHNIRLIALDINTFSTIASIELPSSTATNLIRGSLVRLRNNEIAFRSLNFVVTITGSFVGP